MIANGVIYREIPKEIIKINEHELSARLGCDAKCMEEEVNRALSELYSVISPRYSAVRVGVEIKDGCAVVDGVEIRSENLIKNLGRAKGAFLLALTLGGEVDRCLYRLGIASSSYGFVADAVASALCEAVADIADGELCKGLKHCPRFSPGYGDLPLSYQDALLKRVGAQTLLGIRLTDGFLMLPQKSITAIIGIM